MLTAAGTQWLGQASMTESTTAPIAARSLLGGLIPGGRSAAAGSPALPQNRLPQNRLPPRKRLFLLGWAGFILALYLGIGAAAVSVIGGERAASQDSHRLRMTPGLVERGQTPPDPIPETGSFVPVTTGLYLDGIETLSIRDSFWTPTFYIWFRWNGDRALDPGGNFRLVDGSITRKELQDEYHGADGMHYQRYRVTARMTKFFNTTRVPRDSHLLNLYVEDARLDASRLRYIADPATSVSSRVRVSGYTVSRRAEQAVKTHTYRSSYGDPRSEPGERRTFSMYTYGIDIARNGTGVYFKLFIGLFAGMALAFASFGLRASDAGPRFSMVAGAYFGAVANSYLAGSLIPSSGQFGLVEYVTFLGLFTIFFSLVATIASIYLWTVRGDKELSRAFDLVTVGVAGLGYIAVNIAIPLSA
jgi:hypothetical protein